MRLDLVVGPNGSGKSTFVRLTLVRARPGTAFVNADDIAAARWPDDPDAHAYEAAELAAEVREQLIERRESLIAETVFSHPSKLELLHRAAEAGYHTELHVLLVPEQVAVARVAARVVSGGHPVPEEKIRSRYRRLWRLVAAGITSSDTATVYDNTHPRGARTVASFIGGFPVGDPKWPGWTPEELSSRWPSGGA